MRSYSRTTAKIRVQFDFTPEALARLDDLQEKAGDATRAETVRNALRLYEWLIRVADPESTITIVDKNNSLTAKFKAKLLKEK